MQKLALAFLEQNSEYKQTTGLLPILPTYFTSTYFKYFLSSVFNRKHSGQEPAHKYANHPFACNLSRISRLSICMIFFWFKVVYFKRKAIVSDFLFMLLDRETVLHYHIFLLFLHYP